jgi:uncharacterized protein (DUF1501 family)
MFTRRDSLKALGAGTLAWIAGAPALSLATAPNGRRLVCVFLRGGLDGLSAVAPYGDPAYRGARSGLAVPAPGGSGSALRLDGLFALHPQLANLHAMYLAGECAVLHAAGFPCPERSHFAAQSALLSALRLDLRAALPVRNGRVRPFLETAQAVGASLCRADGPPAAMIDFTGWDTHANQLGVLDRNLPLLDRGLAGLKTSLGWAWKHTIVLVVTEFGRAVAMNDRRGTDHGTGTAAFVLGGAVRGGRVITDWPGLAKSALYRERDLRPTTDLRCLFKAALIAQFGVADSVLETKIFPDSRTAKPLEGLFG